METKRTGSRLALAALCTFDSGAHLIASLRCRPAASVGIESRGNVQPRKNPRHQREPGHDYRDADPVLQIHLRAFSGEFHGNAQLFGDQTWNPARIPFGNESFVETERIAESSMVFAVTAVPA